MRRLSCLAPLLLSSLSSAVSLADVSASPSDGPAPSLGRRDWSTLSRVDAAATPVHWATTRPLLLSPRLASWMLPDLGKPNLDLTLSSWPDVNARYADDAIAGLSAGLGLRKTLLLHHFGADSGVSLTLAPGSPCTGACLKVAGSF
ncbi:MAG TPA: hypothetical protein VHP33_02385 [Polyangiaceae bacterium]|nr:hypothetical protein [Polyangiaceae bacterium]